MDNNINIVENYYNFEPRYNVKERIERLLSIVPSNYLMGLKTIHLTNYQALNHSKKRKKTWSQKRKVKLKNCLGWYYHKSTNQEVWIEILIDKVQDSFPKFFLISNFIKDWILADVLYHEIGHHIHSVHKREFSEREYVAEKWKKQLFSLYFKKKYWLLIKVLRPVGFLIIFVRNRFKKET